MESSTHIPCFFWTHCLEHCYSVLCGECVWRVTILMKSSCDYLYGQWLEAWKFKILNTPNWKFFECPQHGKFHTWPHMMNNYRISGTLKILFKNFGLRRKACRRHRWISWLDLNLNTKIPNDCSYINIHVYINIPKCENI